ncbi:MAG: AraC family transcriptional regulator [Ruminococcaceae bacterium]|nr:AraC family transcriptional regulator [Oscillospiraceae bacterium]
MFSEDFYLDIKKIHIAHKYVLDRVHRCEYPSGRGHYGLVYVQSGSAEYRMFTGERITITEGDTLFLSPDCAYSIVTEREFEHYTVNFDIHLDTSRSDFFNKPYSLLQEEGSERLKRKFIELTNAWTWKNTGFELQATGHLYELLSIFYSDWINRQNAASYRRLLPAREYIEQHFHQPISLEELAKLSNMSVTNFRREWNKVYPDPPLQYRDSIRLYYAKEYLNSGYYTVTEIAEKCGFDDVSYFVRFFKNKVGLTPGEFKRNNLG